MKNTFSKTLLSIFIPVALLATPACTKHTGDAASTCKTCIARDNLEGAPVANEEVCSDAAEDDFRATHSDQNVTCE